MLFYFIISNAVIRAKLKFDAEQNISINNGGKTTTDITNDLSLPTQTLSFFHIIDGVF